MAIPSGTLATRRTSGQQCAEASRTECNTAICRGDVETKKALRVPSVFPRLLPIRRDIAFRGGAWRGQRPSVGLERIVRRNADSPLRRGLTKTAVKIADHVLHMLELLDSSVQDQRTAVRVILNRTGKSKTEIPRRSRECGGRYGRGEVVFLVPNSIYMRTMDFVEGLFGSCALSASSRLWMY